MAGAEENLYEVEQLLVQPGTYFNPQTEVVVVVELRGDGAGVDGGGLHAGGRLLDRRGRGAAERRHAGRDLLLGAEQ